LTIKLKVINKKYFEALKEYQVGSLFLPYTNFLIKDLKFKGDRK